MFNQISALGHIGTDPEMRYTPSGAPVTSFRLATSRKWTDGNGERQERTEWFTVVCWNSLAEQAQLYLAKGLRTYVTGRLQSNHWQGNDGAMHFRMEIVASNITFLDRKEQAAQDGTAGPTAAPAAPTGEPPAEAAGPPDDHPTNGNGAPPAP